MSIETDRLLAIMARLRNPDGGCPWDLEQDFATIAPYTIEEAYEVAEAIALGDLDALREELGDLLLQVVFHAQMATEQGAFDFEDVARGINDKMVRRHPHVFASETVETAEAQTAKWEAHKAAERAEKAAASGKSHSILDGVSVALPGLTRALKLGRRAARVGFDWPAVEPVLEKLQEEIGELSREIEGSGQPARLEEELGDVLFTVANLARHLGLEPEAALRHANRKFDTRFRIVEGRLREQGRSPEDARADELEDLWQEAKAEPPAPSPKK